MTSISSHCISASFTRYVPIHLVKPSVNSNYLCNPSRSFGTGLVFSVSPEHFFFNTLSILWCDYLFFFLVYVLLLVRNHVAPLTHPCFPPLPVKHSQTSCFPPSQDVHFSEVLLKPQIPLKKQRSPMARTLSMVAHCWARDFSEEIIKFSSTPEELALRERLLLPRMVGIYPGIGLQQQEWASAQSEYCNLLQNELSYQTV